ncbi:MAG TPA: type I-MYXAN CRISPR-associated protein Cas6/Cmx6 [Chromatiaceae bacterium]|nr:type I-MYXAN CRISPR-associated protein Cas6/Cmx6 [Chromatiaceae bacterium]
MFWEDETSTDIPDKPSVLDLSFGIESRMLPVDHLHALSEALKEHLPELHKAGIGIHEIHLAGSQNGWERPDPALGQHLIPSRRTRMQLRVPNELAESVRRRLEGAHLDLGGFELRLKQAREKPLFSHPPLYARHMLMLEEEREDENLFLERIVGELRARGIRIKKALCGKTTKIATPDGPLFTRSLMLAELTPAQSLLLQEQGADHGPRHLGCGLFLPMKGIQTLNEE